MIATMRAIESILFEKGKISSPTAVKAVVKIKGLKDPYLSDSHPSTGCINKPPMKKILNRPAAVDSSIPFMEIRYVGKKDVNPW